MNWFDDFINWIVLVGEYLALFLITGAQYIIDFGQLWFGYGPYAEFAPATWFLIMLTLVATAGYRAIEDIESVVNSSANFIIKTYKKSRK